MSVHQTYELIVACRLKPKADEMHIAGRGRYAVSVLVAMHVLMFSCTSSHLVQDIAGLGRVIRQWRQEKGEGVVSISMP